MPLRQHTSPPETVTQTDAVRTLVARPRGPERTRRAKVIEFVAFGGSTGLFQFTRLLVGIAAAAVVPPDRFAIWGIALVVLSYTTFANVGVISGLNREIPIRLGQRDLVRAARLEEAALGWVLACAVVLAGVGGAVAVLFAGDLAVVAGLLAACIGLQQLYLFYQTTLRARLDFNKASVQQFLIAIVFPVAAWPLVMVVDIAGLLFAQVLAYGAGLVFVRRMWRNSIVPIWDPANVRHLSTIGLPIMAAGFIFTVATTADRWLVLGMLGETAMGQYTVAALAASSLLFIAVVVAQQLYPRMAMRFGESMEPTTLWPMAVRHSAIALAMTIPPAAAIFVIAPLVVPVLLPEYGPAIAAAQILSLAFVLLVASSGFSNALVVLGRARAYALWLVVGLVVEVILAVVAVRLGFGLAGIAAAAAGGYAVISAALVFTARRATSAVP